MKKTIKALCYTCLFFVLTAANCRKELPPETQEGKGTFGCLINGEVFKPKGVLLGSPSLTCYYQQLSPGDSGYVFSISAADLSVSDNVKAVILGVGSLKLRQGQAIVLANGVNIGEGRGQYTGESRYTRDYYKTTPNVTGVMNIERFDEALQIVSGTFWFNAVNSTGEEVKVTNGRFDLKYTR